MSTRLATGGRLIDRSETVRFTFNGRWLRGFKGGTLASALLANHSRTCNVIAGANGTRIAFYNLVALSKKNPKKASRTFQAVMEAKGWNEPDIVMEQAQRVIEIAP